MASDQQVGDLDEEQQAGIVKCFWQRDVDGRQLVEYRPYFRFYRTEMRKLFFNIATETRATASLPPPEVSQICSLVECISEIERHKSREDLRTALRNIPSFAAYQDNQLNHSINLALRLWLTINVWEQDFQDLSLDIPIVEWEENVPLLDCVAHQFPPEAPTIALQPHSPRTRDDFTGVNLRRLSGVTISWTSSLPDHLNFDTSQRRLKVYPYKRCLLDHLRRPGSSLIPESVLRETLLTLDVLFPYWDEQTRNFLRDEDQDFLQYDPSWDPRPRNINDFVIWRERLILLLHVYSSPPEGLRQVWHDRRNALQWYTFWLAAFIAMVTVVFGTISSVASVIQAQAALKSMREGFPRQP